MLKLFALSFPFILVNIPEFKKHIKFMILFIRLLKANHSKKHSLLCWIPGLGRSPGEGKSYSSILAWRIPGTV